MRPLIPWPGGKRRLAKHILPHFPAHRCYVEPFAGAAALFWLKDPATVEVLNDVNGDLVNLYRVVRHHPEEFFRQFKWALSSRQMFLWAQDTPPETLTDVQQAARFYYLQQLCFGARVEGRSFGTSPTTPARLNLFRLEEDLSAAHLRLARVHIERLGWHDCMVRYDRPDTLFYLDPPYWRTQGYGVDFGLAEYSRIAEVLGGLQGRAIISVNDVPEMRRAFADYPFESVGITYSMQGKGRGKPARELIIRSWRDSASSARVLRRKG